MTNVNPYHELSREQAEGLHEDLDRRYWDAMEYLEAIRQDRAMVANHLKDLLAKDNQHLPTMPGGLYDND